MCYYYSACINEIQQGRVKDRFWGHGDLVLVNMFVTGIQNSLSDVLTLVSINILNTRYRQCHESCGCVLCGTEQGAQKMKEAEEWPASG